MLLVAALLGAGAVSLSTSYAFGDSFEQKHSLHRTPRTAPFFFAVYGGQIILACLVVLFGGSHFLGVLTQYVQVLAGILLPSAVLFLTLLCNDKDILGPWVNKTWQNVLDFAIVGILLILSLILVVSTLFPSVSGKLLAEVLFGAGFGITLVVVLPALLIARRRRAVAGVSSDPLDVRRLDRDTWRMPPLDQLPAPAMSAIRRAGCSGCGSTSSRRRAHRREGVQLLHPLACPAGPDQQVPPPPPRAGTASRRRAIRPAVPARRERVGHRLGQPPGAPRRPHLRQQATASAPAN